VAGLKSPESCAKQIDAANSNPIPISFKAHLQNLIEQHGLETGRPALFDHENVNAPRDE
jgi:hypothetical protein